MCNMLKWNGTHVNATLTTLLIEAPNQVSVAHIMATKSKELPRLAYKQTVDN